MIHNRLFATFLLLGFTLGACKEDAAAGLDSGVDEGKSGDQLSPDEQEQFCEAAQAYGAQVLPENEARDAGCTFTGILGSLLADGSPETCEIVRKDCIANPPQTPPASDTCDLGIDWATCMATVAEVEACYEEYAESFAANMRSLSCAKMAEYATAMPSVEVEVGPDCSLAKAKCPTVIGGAAGGSDM